MPAFNEPPPWGPQFPAGYQANPNELPLPVVPEAVIQEGALLPPGFAPEGPSMPYGMGLARSFLDVPPLVHWADGTTCLNPDYNALSIFSIQGLAPDPTFPDRSNIPNPTIPVGGQTTFRITVDREENGLGHLLLRELFMQAAGGNGVADLTVTIRNPQADLSYTNGPVPALNVFGTAFLGSCMPCPSLIYPNQSLLVTVFNTGAAPVQVEILARGRRFMPYHDLRLAQEMEHYWSWTRSIPYFLGFDQEVTVPAGGTAQGQMSLPGAGYFEMAHRMVQVVPAGGGTTPYDLEVLVTDGRIGTRFMDGPVNLAAHWAAPTLAVAGFPGGLFRAVQAEHCPPTEQLIRGNTRLIHDFTNNGADDAIVRLTYSGCFHFVDACPPKKDLDLMRRYGKSSLDLERAAMSGDRFYSGFAPPSPFRQEVSRDCSPSEGMGGLRGAGPEGLGASPANGEWGRI